MAGHRLTPWVGRGSSQSGRKSMNKLESVSLDDARRMIEAGERKAREIGQPSNIAVVDAGGNLVAHIRMDGSWIGSVDGSINKAFTARAFDISTADLADNGCCSRTPCRWPPTAISTSLRISCTAKRPTRVARTCGSGPTTYSGPRSTLDPCCCGPLRAADPARPRRLPELRRPCRRLDRGGPQTPAREHLSGSHRLVMVTDPARRLQECETAHAQLALASASSRAPQSGGDWW